MPPCWQQAPAGAQPPPGSGRGAPAVPGGSFWSSSGSEGAVGLPVPATCMARAGKRRGAWWQSLSCLLHPQGKGTRGSVPPHGLLPPTAGSEERCARCGFALGGLRGFIQLHVFSAPLQLSKLLRRWVLHCSSLSSWGGRGKELDHRAGNLFQQAEAVRALSWGSGDLRPVPAPRAKFAVDQARRSPLCASVSHRRGGGVDVRSRGWMSGGPGGRAGCVLGWAPQVLSVPQFPMCAG